MRTVDTHLAAFCRNVQALTRRSLTRRAVARETAAHQPVARRTVARRTVARRTATLGAAILWSVWCLAGVWPALAAEEEELAPGYSACLEKAVSTLDMQQCTSDAYDYWDKILNENYAQALQQCTQAEDEKACRDKIRTAQRLWVQYKEAMTDVIVELEGGGSLSRLLASDFAATETKKQARLLEPSSGY